METPLLIYCPAVTTRVSYIFDFIFQEMLGLGYTLTSSQFDFIHAPGPRMSYHQRRITKEELFISCHTLLFEKDIQPQLIHCYAPRNGYKAFFKGNGDTDFPFDIFAAAFYLLSRYEEYLPHQKDAHGRFAAEQSLACREGFLQEPLIHSWVEDLRSTLQNKFPGMSFRRPDFRFRPTFDIDNPFRYLHRGGRQTWSDYTRDLAGLRFGRIAARTATLLNKRQDPYDCYRWLDALHRKSGLEPRYFFLVGERNGKDKILPPLHPALLELIRNTASQYPVGLHSSRHSHHEAGRLEKEKQLLETAAGITVTHSRQHYLLLEFPDTYRKLIAAGITDDHSMGYSERNGFRASVCTPFLWYDLGNDSRTELRIHPFCFMDTTAFFYLRYSPAGAMDELCRLADAVKKAGGEMIALWHNESLGSSPQWKGWREVYEEFIKNIT